jgi:hypothetical protein
LESCYSPEKPWVDLATAGSSQTRGKGQIHHRGGACCSGGGNQGTGMAQKIYHLLLILSLVSLSACKLNDRPLHERVAVARSGEIITFVDYGFKGDKVVFVYFATGERTLPPGSHFWSHTLASGKNECVEATITRPDGTKLNLLTTKQGYQYAGKAFSEFPIDFSRTELKAYVASETNRFSIEGFRAYRARPHPPQP